LLAVAFTAYAQTANAQFEGNVSISEGAIESIKEELKKRNHTTHFEAASSLPTDEEPVPVVSALRGPSSVTLSIPSHGLLVDDESEIAPVAGNEAIVGCNFSGFPIFNLSFSASYLGYTFLSLQGPYAGTTPYDQCTRLSRDVCYFLTQEIGVPQPLAVRNTGNISNQVRQCGTF
jgi:hypothetical protein